MNPNSPSDIAQALLAGRFPDAQEWNLAAASQLIADGLIGSATGVSAIDIRKAVGVLNSQRYFELTRVVAKAWSDTHGFDPTIHRRYVQALINTSLLDEAEKLARLGIAKCQEQPADQVAAKELPEFQGLLGRIFKQRFVIDGDRNDLVNASDQYLNEYRKDPARNYWHGVNALALLTREQSDGPPRPKTPALKKLALSLHATVTEAYAKQPGSWLAATASEVCLALGKCDDAELWLYRFLHLKDTQPFDIDSYARQLREIWRGDPVSPSGSCPDRLAGIIARFLSGMQRRVQFSPAEAIQARTAVESGSPGFEKNFLSESTFGVAAIRSMLEACRAIGCVSNDIGERLGTGFLVSGNWLNPRFGAAPVFVTNAHVISDDVPKAIPRGKVRVTFELEDEVNGQRREYRVQEVLFTSPPGKIGVTNNAGTDLDCTIVRLAGLAADVAVLQCSAEPPVIESKSKAYVVGHPRGAGLQISLHDSRLLDVDDDWRLMHYRTPTDPGSSGSPVFNEQWEVVGLHHAGTSETPRLHGSGTYEANEAIVLGAIRRTL
jgi:hypothetical protein